MTDNSAHRAQHHYLLQGVMNHINANLDAPLDLGTLTAATKRESPPGTRGLRFEVSREGLSAQILHIGRFDAEGPTIGRLHSEI